MPRLDLTSRLFASGLSSTLAGGPAAPRDAPPSAPPSAPDLPLPATTPSLPSCSPADVRDALAARYLPISQARAIGLSVEGGGSLSIPDAPLSAAATALLTASSTAARRYIHGARALLDGEASSQLAGRADEAPTFMEALCLPPRELEALTRGKFVYARPRACGASVALPPATVGGPARLPATDTPAYYAFPSPYVMEYVPSSARPPGAAGGPGEAALYTVSAAGVTWGLHLEGAGAAAEFTGLAQWEREATLFHALRRIPLLQRFRSWKAFHTWRTCVARCKQRAAARTLTERLFLLSPPLRGALLRVRWLCDEVRGWSLFAPARAEAPYSLEEFCAAQAARRAEVTAWLTEFAGDVRGLVRGACDEVLDAFLAAQRIQPQSRMTFTERAALRGVCRRLRRFVKTADFIVRDTLTALALDAAAALVRMVAAPLGGGGAGWKEGNGGSWLGGVVVRMELPIVAGGMGGAGGLGMGGAGGLGMGGAGGLASLAAPLAQGARASSGERRPSSEGARETTPMEPPPTPPQMPLLELTLSFELPGGGFSACAAQAFSGPGDAVSPLLLDTAPALQPLLRVRPSLTQTKAALRTLLLDGMVAISLPPRLLTHADLAPYTRAAADPDDEESADDDVDLTEAVTSHPGYRRLPSEMAAALDAAYAAVDSYCAVFAPFLASHARGERMSAAQRAPGYATGALLALAPSQFERAVAAYRRWASALLLEVPASADVGILRCDSAALKRRLLPQPEACLAGMQAALPGVLQALAQGAVGDVRRLSRGLTCAPRDVPAFLAKLAELSEAPAALLSLRAREARIRAVAQLMAANSWPIPEPVVACSRALQEALSEADAAADAASAQRAGEVARWAAEVEAAAPEAAAALGEVRAAMDAAAEGAEEVEAPPCAVVAALSAAGDSLMALQAHAAALGRWRAELGMPPAPPAHAALLEATEAELRQRSALWRGCAAWEETHAVLCETHISRVDASALQMQIAAAHLLADECTGGGMHGAPGLPASDDLCGDPSRPSERAPETPARLPASVTAAALRLRESAARVAALLPLMSALIAPALARRHWEATLCAALRLPPLAAAAARPLSAGALAAGSASAPPALPPPALTVGHLLEADAAAPVCAAIVERVAADAAREAALDSRFARGVVEAWRALDLPVAAHRSAKDVWVLQAPCAELLEELWGSSATIEDILASPHAAHIAAEVRDYRRRLDTVRTTLGEWLRVQRLWLHLEPSLTGKEAESQPVDAVRRFGVVDRAWRLLMKRTANNPNALSCCGTKGLRDTLRRHADALAAVSLLTAQQLHASCVEIADALARSKAGPEDLARAGERVLPVLREDTGATLAALRRRWGVTLEEEAEAEESCEGAGAAPSEAEGGVPTHSGAPPGEEQPPEGDRRGGEGGGEESSGAAAAPLAQALLSTTELAAQDAMQRRLASLLPEASQLLRTRAGAAASVVEDVPSTLLAGLAYIHVSEVRSAITRKHAAVSAGALLTLSSAVAAAALEALAGPLAASEARACAQAAASDAGRPGGARVGAASEATGARGGAGEAALHVMLDGDALTLLAAAYRLMEEHGFVQPWRHAIVCCRLRAAEACWA